MQRQHTGRPDTVVVPAGWEATHGVVLNRTMTATAALRDPDAYTDGDWDPVTEQTTRVPAAAYYTGPCRVQALATQARIAVTADDPEMVAGYLVTVDADVDPVENHLVTVTETGDDALDGKPLRIRQVIRGSLRFERDLICTLID